MQEQEFYTSADIRCEIDSQIQEIKAILEMMASVEVTASHDVYVKGSDSAKLVSQIMCARVLEKLIGNIEQLNDSCEEVGEVVPDREKQTSGKAEPENYKVVRGHLENAVYWANNEDHLNDDMRDKIFGFCEIIGLPVGWDMESDKLAVLDGKRIGPFVAGDPEKVCSVCGGEWLPTPEKEKGKK